MMQAIGAQAVTEAAEDSGASAVMGTLAAMVVLAVQAEAAARARIISVRRQLISALDTIKRRCMYWSRWKTGLQNGIITVRWQICRWVIT